MTRLKAEPPDAIQSMEELFAVAAAMEREAIEGYRALANRMRQEGRDDLVAVFERLVAEESGHLGNVDDWSRRLTGSAPDSTALRWQPDSGFDDEGGLRIAPELLSAYRAFSTAVRNEERAFAFWTYVAAHSAKEGLQKAAEQMAREELEHVATLRRERRRAFHTERETGNAESWTLAALEERLADLLETGKSKIAAPAQAAANARQRSAEFAARFGPGPALLRNVRAEASAEPHAVAELLLDAYLELGESLPTEDGRAQAQKLAAELIELNFLLRPSATSA